MHLVSRIAQRVRIPAADLDVRFADGESIWTESSYKYTPDALVELGRRAGFERRGQWIDRDAGFAVTLFCARA
jgi:uncharacterized SAM-dependent methyltransferase